MVILKTRTGMIPANETEIMFTDVVIDDDSIIEIYYDNNNVYTVESWQDGDNVHVVCSEHDYQVGVKILINNVSSFSPYDDTEILQAINDINTDILELSRDMSNKQDILTEGDNIKIDNNIISFDGKAIDIPFNNTGTDIESTNTQDAITEVFQSVSNGKVLIASAITDKGIETLATDTFQTMADNISQISGGGGGNAKAFFGPYVYNTYISEGTGNELYYSGWYSTDFLDLEGYAKLAVSLKSDGQGIYNAYYDANKNYIGRLTVDTNYTNFLTKPNNARYVRLSTSMYKTMAVFAYNN